MIRLLNLEIFMSIIRILPENLVNQIAAGEVIERPSSVVKELVENSLDAGADRISVEIKDGGKTLIKISDNGCGMSREDLELSIQRHATSKLSEEKDLWSIKTMGFRGEALASIASVSRMTIKSKQRDEVSGYELNVEGGEKINLQEVGMNEGTVIEIFDLFFNTPARQKYLKQDSTEFGHISSAVSTIALAHPDKSFELINNGKTVLNLPKVTDILARISDIFGAATAEAMLPVFYGGSDFQLDGFIGKPLLSRSTAQHQYFFVNGRPIQHHLLANRIKAAYHSMLMENKKPVFVINIKIDPALIDVNVHPRKLEIRFEDQQSIVKTIYGACSSALEKTNLIPKGFSESQRYMSDKFPLESNVGRENFSAGNYSFKPGAREVQNAFDFSKQILAERDHTIIEESKTEVEKSIRPVVQIANSYIVAESDEGLILIDQHAAHEKVRFEELMDQFENQQKSVQPLLVPQNIELSGEEAVLIEDNLSIFEDLGFQIENFGGKTFIIYAVPLFLAKEAVDEVVKGVLDDLINQKSPSKLQGRTEEILTYMSCRSAIKFGQKLNMPEMEALIDQMETLKRPYTCPHGRPTMIKLTLSELEKMFGRK